MSSSKSRTPCFIAGCVTVAAIFIVVVIMLSVLFLHIPEAADFSERMGRDTKLHTVLLTQEDGLDVSKLSEQSSDIYKSLQAGYSGAHAESSKAEDGTSVSGAAFPCAAIVEYYSLSASADSEDYIYGMLIYTDSISTAYDVFTTYYRIANEQSVDFSNTDYFLFVRGAAVFVGNNKAFNKAYMSNMF